MTKKYLPLHPGEVLREEFLKEMNLTPYAVAKACGIPRTRIERIANEQMGITADTALRLSKLFGNSAAFWLNLQNRYDLLTAEKTIASDLKKIARLDSAA